MDVVVPVRDMMHIWVVVRDVASNPPIEFRIALLLLSTAPSFITFVVGSRYSIRGEAWHTNLHVTAITFLVALNVVAFGLPKIVVPSLLAVGVATSSGSLYYAIEQLRLKLTYQGAIRVAKRVDQLNPATTIVLATLIWTGVVEEVLFRWYILLVPVKCGLIPGGMGILVSTVAFALAHQNFGVGTMMSRGAFGFVLTVTVLTTENLLLAILAHAAYNALVCLWPVRYVQVRRGSIP